ncbi:MAG: hypothetical protein JW940_02510 [Polyangiaceae bacterium]|nr:hypothetical protein [Polyangiaceae bacterium]
MKNRGISSISREWRITGKAVLSDPAQAPMARDHATPDRPFRQVPHRPANSEGTLRSRGTSTYAPGAKENGGIFCRNNCWAVVAAAKLGWACRRKRGRWSCLEPAFAGRSASLTSTRPRCRERRTSCAGGNQPDAATHGAQSVTRA